MRDGDPLPGCPPAQVVSQLAHRVFGPLHLDRTRVVLDYHGLADRAAGTLADVAARHGVTTRTVSLQVKAVRAAGATLPLTPAVTAEATRRSTPAEDHLARVRTARTLGLPDPHAPGKAPVLITRPGVVERRGRRLVRRQGADRGRPARHRDTPRGDRPLTPVPAPNTFHRNGTQHRIDRSGR